MKPRPGAGEQDSGGGLGRDAIIGIVVGSVVAACAIGYCIYLAMMRRKPAREPGARPNPADQGEEGHVSAVAGKDEENGYTVQQQNLGAHDAQGLMAGHKESGFPENDSRQPHYIASDNTAYIAPVQQPSSPLHHDPHAQHWNQQHNPQLAPLQTQFPQQQRPVEPPRQSTYSDVSQPTPPMFQGQFQQNEPPRQSTYSDVSNASPSQPQPQSQYQTPQPFQPTYQSDPSHYHQHQSTPSPQPAVRQQTNRQSSYEYYQQQNQQQQQQYQSQGPAGQYQAFQPPPSQFAQQGPASPVQEYIPDGLRVGSPVAPYRGDQHGLIPVASDQQHGQGRQS